MTASFLVPLRNSLSFFRIISRLRNGSFFRFYLGRRYLIVRLLRLIGKRLPAELLFKAGQTFLFLLYFQGQTLVFIGLFALFSKPFVFFLRFDTVPSRLFTLLRQLKR